MIYLKKVFLSLILISAMILVSCREDEPVAPNNNNPEEKLLKAYNNDSITLLKDFLNEWNNAIQPIGNSELNQLPDSVQEVYSIYKAFYDPLNLNQYGDSTRTPEVGNDYYADVNYFVVQNSISLSIDEEQPQDVIENFKPNLNFSDSIRILYFKESYSEMLHNFLNVSNYGEQNDRFDFISSCLQIVPKHGFGWHFLTHPEVFNISFNNNYNEAKVYFRIRFEGGTADFEKQNGNWVMISSTLTWIE